MSLTIITIASLIFVAGCSDVAGAPLQPDAKAPLADGGAPTDDLLPPDGPSPQDGLLPPDGLSPQDGLPPADGPSPADGAPLPPACTEPLGGTWDLHVLQFESLSPPLVVRITRQADPMSVGFKADYELQMMLVETGGSTHCVTDPANLEYTSTHHNWHDQARALDQGSWYTLALDYIFPAPGNWDVEVHWEFALTVEDANSGQVILGPVLLEQTGGPPI